SDTLLPPRSVFVMVPDPQGLPPFIDGGCMIDHVSVSVRDLPAAGAFYERLLAPLGYAKLVTRPGSIGFGKKYPELWLNARPDMASAPANPGGHIALRAASQEAARAFHAAA